MKLFNFASVIGWIARAVVAGLLMIGAVSKLVHPLSAVPAIEFLEFPLVSANALGVVSVLTAIELCLAFAVIGFHGRRWPLVLVGLTFIVFTLVLVRLATLAGAPGCGCAGLLSSSADPVVQTRAGVVRNMGVLLAVAWLATLRSSPRAAKPGLRPGAHAAPRGFTLVELLVSISVVAVLVSLAIPALRGARLQAKATVSLSALRQVHAATGLYVSDSADYLPFLAEPREPWRPLVVAGVTLGNAEYFNQRTFVGSLLTPAYLSDPAFLEFNEPPFKYPAGVVHSRFEMSCTAFAAPPFWRGASPPDDLNNFIGMRISDAVYPAQKGLYVDEEESLQPLRAQQLGELGPWMISRVDGSAAAERYDRGYVQPFVRSYGCAPVPGMMMTVDGFAGRDF